MQTWINQHPSAFALILLLGFVLMWILPVNLIALLSGWRLLATRFRLQGEFPEPKWSFQSAQMRWFNSYNGCLTVGANQSGLFIRPIFLFRPGHPPLLVPWTEITAGTTQTLFKVSTEFRLGRTEQVPFKIRSALANHLRAAAGQGWPAAPTAIK